MKKLLYIASLFLLVFTACEPMEDVYKEVDEAHAQKIADEKYFAARTVLDENYTLVDADYALSSNEGLKKYKSFSSRATAKDKDYLPDFLKTKFPDAKADDIVVVTYKFYNGKGVVNITENWQFDGTVWAENPDAGPKAPELPAGVKVYEMVKADYKSMGFKYPNFSGSFKPTDYLPTFLKLKYPYAKKGAKYLMVYGFYKDKKTTLQAAEYTLTDGVWKPYSKVIMESCNMHYKKAEKTWVYVTPLRFEYTTDETNIEDVIELKNEDYELTGDGTFHNFSFQGKSEKEQHKIALEKLNIILRSNYSLKEGNIFKVTYKYYTGSVEKRTVTLKALLDE